MTIHEFLDNITDNNIRPIKNTSAITIEDFYKTTIEANLPKFDIIKKWGTILQRYVNEKQVVFFIRRYEKEARRGLLTEFNNCHIIYCDNFLAHYFYHMAIEGFVPEYDDFKRTMLSFEFPLGHLNTRQEGELSVTKLGKHAKINPKGWKLAHIYSVTQKGDNPLFEKGERTDWIKKNGQYSRKGRQDLKDNDLDKIKAHFLRLVHPINYFLVPNAKRHQSDVGNNIGESADLLQFMKNKQQKRFGQLFMEYKKNIAAPDKHDATVDPGIKIINIIITEQANEAKKKAVKKEKAIALKDASVIKIGEYVKKSFTELSKNNLLNRNDIELLLNKAYSKTTFNINFPFLIEFDHTKKLDELRTVNGYPRYWKGSIKINGIDYLVCQEWYEYNRSFFTNWLNKLN